jgi:hypothetical protein
MEKKIMWGKKKLKQSIKKKRVDTHPVLVQQQS